MEKWNSLIFSISTGWPDFFHHNWGALLVWLLLCHLMGGMFGRVLVRGLLGTFFVLVEMRNFFFAKWNHTMEKHTANESTVQMHILNCRWNSLETWNQPMASLVCSCLVVHWSGAKCHVGITRGANLISFLFGSNLFLRSGLRMKTLQLFFNRLTLSKLDLVGLGWPFEQQFMGAETCKCPFFSWHRKAVSSWKKFLRMGQWIFAEYAWTVFVRADLEAQVVLSHLVYRKSFLVLLVVFLIVVGAPTF